MKLSATREVVAVRLESLKTNFPSLKVHRFKGVFSSDELKRFYSATPALLVSALSSGVEGVKIAVYVLTKLNEDPLDLVDRCVEVLRVLPGEGRPILDVAARSLYDVESGVQNACLWGLVALWPHQDLSDSGTGAINTASSSLIRQKIEGLKILAQALPYSPAAGGNEAEISRLNARSILPRVEFRSENGSFDSLEAGFSRWNEADKLMRRKVLGLLKAPLKVDFIGMNEGEAERMALNFVSHFPQLEDSQGIHSEVHVDEYKGAELVNNYAKVSLYLDFSTQVGLEPEILPQIRSVSLQTT